MTNLHLYVELDTVYKRIGKACVIWYVGTTFQHKCFMSTVVLIEL